MLYIKALLVVVLIYEVMEVVKLRKLLKTINPVLKKDKIRPYSIILLFGILFFINYEFAIIIGLLLLANYSQHKRRVIRKKKKVIGYYGYKIFKFLMNQTSSGIKVSDALQGLYQIVDDKELRRNLIEVSACFGHTADLHQALNLLKSNYNGIEVQTLCVAIEQGIDTGSNYETLIKMEGLLFKKYIYQIQKDTVLRKKRGVLATLYLCIVVVLLVAVPVVMDMLTAFNKIFY